MKKILLPILAIAAMTSCSKESSYAPNVNDNRTPIQLNAAIENHIVAKSAVEGSTFPANAEGVFYVTAYSGTAVPTTAYQTTHFAGEAVNSGVSSALTFATTQYYPADPTKKLFFYAYAPTVTSLTAGTATTAPIAKYTITGKEDIMSAIDVSGISKVSSGVTQTHPTFTFAHQLKQIKFKVVAGDNFPTGVTVTKITIKGVKNSANLNVITGKVTFDATTADLVAYAYTPGTLISTTATPIPGNLMFEPGETFVVSVEASGVTYPNATVTLNGTGAGEAGKSHTVTLTFKPTGITPTAAVTEWSTGNDANIDIQ